MIFLFDFENKANKNNNEDFTRNTIEISVL